MREYYRKLFNTSGFEHDKDELIEAINNYDFQDVKKQYRIIENNEQIIVIVPYKNKMDIYNKFKDAFYNNDYSVKMSDIKKVQSITISTYDAGIKHYCHEVFLQSGNGEKQTTGIHFMNDDGITNLYDEITGLQASNKCDKKSKKYNPAILF